jgi:hypothetical protein
MGCCELHIFTRRAVMGCFEQDKIFMMYLLSAIYFSTCVRNTVQKYKKTIPRTIQNKQYISNTTILEECGPCPVLALYSLSFALQPSKNTEKHQSV